MFASHSSHSFLLTLLTLLTLLILQTRTPHIPLIPLTPLLLLLSLPFRRALDFSKRKNLLGENRGHQRENERRVHTVRKKDEVFDFRHVRSCSEAVWRWFVSLEKWNFVVTSLWLLSHHSNPLIIRIIPPLPLLAAYSTDVPSFTPCPGTTTPCTWNTPALARTLAWKPSQA